MTFLYRLILLFAGHALCDYPLQSDFLARGKNHRLAKCHDCGKDIRRVKNDFWAAGPEVCDGNHWHKPAPVQFPAWQLLFAHSLIHSGMVLLVTRSVWLALAELSIHYITDWMKCEDLISFNQDQAIHYLCKVLWAVLA